MLVWLLLVAQFASSEQALAARLEQGEWVEGLILRYGTARIYPRVRAAYEHRRPPCLTALNYYFLRVDPAFGKREIRRHFAAGSDFPPVCRETGWGVTNDFGPWVASPAMDEVLLEALGSGPLRARAGAAELLGQYGSVRAKQRLWDALDELHRRGNPDEAPLDRALRAALAHAGAWLLTSEEWLRLLQDCGTDDCKAEVLYWGRQANRREIRLADSGWDYFGTVGDFRAATERIFLTKLQQYPRGSAFRWTPDTSGSKEHDDAAYCRWKAVFEGLALRLER